MSVQHLAWVLDHSDTKHAERFVLLALANHADEHDECWPSEAAIAYEANLSIGQVRRAIKGLVEAGRIERTVNGAPVFYIRADRRPNLYRLVMKDEREGWRADRERVRGYVAPVDETGARKCADGRAESAFTGARNPRAETTEEPTEEPSLRSAPDGAGVDDAFDRFWNAYPKRVDKGAARRAWKAAVKKVSAEFIIEAAREYADDPARRPQFTKYPATWLNAEAWANGDSVYDDGLQGIPDNQQGLWSR